MSKQERREEHRSEDQAKVQLESIKEMVANLEAAEGDGGKEECGEGLHAFCHPLAALKFNTSAKKFVALPVRLKDFKPFPNAQYPDKVKFEKVAGPIWECDRNGKPVK